MNRPGILGELDAADGAICTVAELLAKLGHRQESEAVIALEGKRHRLTEHEIDACAIGYAASRVAGQMRSVGEKARGK